MAGSARPAHIVLVLLFVFIGALPAAARSGPLMCGLDRPADNAIPGFTAAVIASALAAAIPDSPAGKVHAQVDAAVDAPGPPVIDARLVKHPLSNAPATWRHQLLRSKFSFAEIKGEVKAFRLACFDTTHEGQVDTETLWDVSAKAGACLLRVDGAPGASFKLVESW